MAKEQTAMHELIDFIMTAQALAEQGECLMPNITDVLNEIERLKEKERKQIEDAYSIALSEYFNHDGDSFKILSKKYYKTKYK